MCTSDQIRMVTDMTTTDDAIKSKLDDVERRLHAHPGFREYLDWKSVKRTLDAVFFQNQRVLLTILARPSQDPALAIQLFQNTSAATVRDGYELAVTNALHNYVAGTATLIDHTRRLMQDREGKLADEYRKRVTNANANHPELRFIKELRNYVLHVTHPFIGHTVTFASAQGPITAEIELSHQELLDWDGWHGTSRPFIEAQGEKIALRPIVESHGRIMIDLHVWLLQQLAEENREALDDANKLVVERNGILSGLSSEAAERLTDAVTAQRESTVPITTEEMLAKLRALDLHPNARGNGDG
jgi:hypothetical protein